MNKKKIILATASAAVIGIIGGTSIVKAEEINVFPKTDEQLAISNELVQESVNNLETVSNIDDFAIQQNIDLSNEVISNEQATQIVQDGWEIQPDGNYKYVQNGQYITENWLSLDGYSYYFGYDGIAYRNGSYGIYDFETQVQYYYGFDDSCRMITGWHTFDYSDYYYYGLDGKAYTGYQNIEGLNYLFSDWGQLVPYSCVNKGVYYEVDTVDHHVISTTPLNYGAWTQIGEEWYYYDELGNPYQGWKNIGGYQYYFDYEGKAYRNGNFGIYDSETPMQFYYGFNENCQMVTGWYIFDYSTYYYGLDGKAYTGYQNIEGVNYLFSGSGQLVVSSCVENGVYYEIDTVDHHVISTTTLNYGGWTQIGKDWYYYNELGDPYQGWHQINGSNYYFDYHGKAHRNAVISVYENGIQNIYGFDNDCRMVTGWFKYQNNWFYFGTDGIALTGIQTINGSRYYFSESFQNPIMIVDSTVVDMQTNLIYFCDINGVASEIHTTNGWNLIDGDWYYLENGVLIKNQVKDINGVTYAFNEYGRLCNGLIENINGSQYIVDENGCVVKGQWILSEDIYYGPIWYLSNDDGTPYHGWYQNYYIESGRMVTGVRLIDNQYYLFGEDGVLQSSQQLVDGWNFIQGNYFYFENGQLVVGWKSINGQTYYFDSYNKMMQRGIVFDNNDYKYYLLSSSGALVRDRWVHHPITLYGDSCWTYSLSDGSLAYNQWVQLGNKWYYFKDYVMVTGNVIIDHILYHFDTNGVMTSSESLTSKNGWVQSLGEWSYYQGGRKLKGWQFINGQWYYFTEPQYDEHVFMVTGSFIIDNELYFFNQNGCLLTNSWGYDSRIGSWYYTDHRGIVLTGWHHINGNTYYFDQYGSMAYGGIYRIDRKEYRFADSGAYLGEYIPYSNGWKYIDGNWYFYENGVRKTMDRIGNYFVDRKGKMITNGYPEECGLSLLWGKGATGGLVGPYVYTDAQGNILKNHWVLFKGAWYYMDADGYLVRDKTIKINGVYYTFDTDGSMFTY